MSRPVLLVVSGPSGAGKSTLVDRYVRAHRDRTALIVSATTRPRRPSEVDGEDYHFLSREDFDQKVRDEQFVEWAEVHGNCYGTPRDQVEAAMAAGRDVILEIDVQGGLQVQGRMAEAVLCFLTPPSRADLEARLRGRAEDSEEVIQARLKNALEEYQALRRYDYLVVNERLEAAQADLEAIVAGERCSLRGDRAEAVLAEYLS